MRRIRVILPLAAIVLLAGLPVRAQEGVFRVNDDDVKPVLVRIERGADSFRKSLDQALDKSRFDGTRREDNVNAFVRDFEVATDRLRKNFDERHPAASDAAAVLEHAARIDRFMGNHALTDRAQSDWRYLRDALDQLALAYSVTWTWDGTAVVTRVNDDDVKSLLRRIETDADRFRTSLDDALDKSSFDHTRAENDINRFVKEFEQATDRWKSRFGDRNTAASDATEVLRRAATIDDFLVRNPLTPRAQSDWATLRTTLDDLARAYNVTWAWGGVGTVELP